MRILVVEDQDSIRNMIEALVRARGFEVTAVSSGAKALDVAQTNPPDIVLLDLMMPGQYDGIEVCERLRMNPDTAKIPVFIISAALDEKNKARAEAAGATAYYSKPFSPIALLKEIERFKPAK
jgi:CheY-like chemotaxis protein